MDDSFDLFDLRVEIIAPAGAKIYCGKVGDWSEMRREQLHLPPGQSFSIYSLAAVLPLLPAKQRQTHPHDWMTSDAEIACPDPNCPSRLRITRLASAASLLLKPQPRGLQRSNDSLSYHLATGA